MQPVDHSGPASLESATESSDGGPPLTRSLNLPQAIAINVANMVGIGPFITIPLFIAAMEGPHAIIAWIIAAVLVICDGLVWSELGAALPGSGGTYHFFKNTYGRLHPFWGQLMPFLFIWQFFISGPLEIASAYLGTMDYLRYVLEEIGAAPLIFGVDGQSALAGPLTQNILAAAACVVVTLLLCRRIQILGWMSIILVTGTLLAVLTIIVFGLANFDPALLTWPSDVRWSNPERLFRGLGAAMMIAIYDYLGYYNVCHLGEEVREPGKTIPRAVIASTLIVATIYLLMNIAIIGVIPWSEAMTSKNIAADVMERLFGRGAALAFSLLVVWAVVAGTFALKLGYSRIPYAAARQGDFFRVFGILHPTGRYPIVSLLTLGLITAGCCFLKLQDVINAAVAVRIVVQFIGQIAALHILRTKFPEVPMPFRMWCYPIPSLLALVGWIFTLQATDATVLWAAVLVSASGIPVFVVWKLLKTNRAE